MIISATKKIPHHEYDQLTIDMVTSINESADEEVSFSIEVNDGSGHRIHLTLSELNEISCAIEKFNKSVNLNKE